MNHSIDLSYIIDQAWWCRHNGGEENRCKEDLRYKFSASYLWPLKSVLFYNFILTLFSTILPTNYYYHQFHGLFVIFSELQISIFRWLKRRFVLVLWLFINLFRSILINRPETFSLINRKFLCNHMQGKRSPFCTYEMEIFIETRSHPLIISTQHSILLHNFTLIETWKDRWNTDQMYLSTWLRNHDMIWYDRKTIETKLNCLSLKLALK